MKNPFVIHPFLFAIFPVVFLFSHNIEQVTFSEVLLPSAIVLGFTILLLLLSRVVFRDSKKAGIVVSIFLVLWFSYGHVFDTMQGRQIGSLVIGRQRYLMLSGGILFTCGVYFIMRTRRDLHNFTNILNIVAMSLIVISLIKVGVYEFKTRGSWEDNSISLQEGETDSSGTAARHPDIYYIILDRHASASTLKEIYGFDNSKFLNYLSNKGFYVASESKSNYLVTAHSLASSLNMEFINYLTDKVGEESNDWTVLYVMLQDYKVWRFLKSKGYKFIHFGSSWEPTRKNKYADKNFNFFSMPEFLNLLYRTTILYYINHRLGIRPDFRMEQWKRVTRKFEKLAEMPNMKGPIFVFAHMLVPHDPFVFDRNGNFINEPFTLDRNADLEDNKAELHRRYINQLIFTNKMIKELIDKLLSSSEVSPIIILQGDEGPFPTRIRFDRTDFRNMFNATDFNWRDKATDMEIRQKMKILQAYYLPDIDNSVLYPSITPVNSFRLIFNLYFNTHFELLPDESYAHEDGNHIYKFFNVTDKVK